jgi:hypothetical protein
MARRVYLHIGTMKSATSYIGQLCELNTGYLRESGVLWPGEALRYKGIRDLFGRAVRETDFTGCWVTLRRQIRQFDGDVLLSNELLAAVHAHQIRRLVRALGPAEVHVVVTARDLARVIPSHWQTTLKNGSAQPWLDFAAAVCTDEVPDRAEGPDDGAENDGEDEDERPSTAARTHAWFWRRHDVAAILARWEAFVPADRVTLVTVPGSGSDPEIVAKRFGAVLGVELTGLTQPEWSNASLGAHSAELLRRLNHDLPGLTPAERSYGFRGALAGSLVAARSGAEPRFALTQAQQDWVTGRAHVMIEQIERAGARVEGDLADLIPSASPPPGSVDPAETSQSDLLEVAAVGVMAMVKAYAEMRVERRDVGKQREALRSGLVRLQQRTERQQKRLDTLVSQRRRSFSGRARALLGRSSLLRGLVRRVRR